MNNQQISAEKMAEMLRTAGCFEVNPRNIDQTVFKQSREDPKQEETRKLILEAFEELNANTLSYGKKFYMMLPDKEWDGKTPKELIELAWQKGDHNAYWVEQALEWAQRIASGETWEAICNEKDTADYFRLVIWKDGEPRLVGGSREAINEFPAADVGQHACNPNGKLHYVVPAVVLY